MRLSLKDSAVNLDSVTDRILYALLIACQVWKRHGMSLLTVTSANDGEHKTNSLHYTGNAVDLRTHTLPDQCAMRDELAEELGDDYDVVLEVDHLHIEFDPRP